MPREGTTKLTSSLEVPDSSPQWWGLQRTKAPLNRGFRIQDPQHALR